MQAKKLELHNCDQFSDSHCRTPLLYNVVGHRQLKPHMKMQIEENIVTRFHGNAWVAVVGLAEAVVARQQGKRICAGQQHATVGRAVLSVLPAKELYTRG
jgi:hypothetical protein